LQHRMLAERVMRGEEGSEFQARHIGFSQMEFSSFSDIARLRADAAQGNRPPT
jgi:hypothetical protein